MLTDCSDIRLDKSNWGERPWQWEPDKHEFVDRATGLPCLIRRVRYGNLCGYVSVPELNPYYGLAYNEKPTLPILHTCEDDWCDCSAEDVFRVHGGITFSGESFDEHRVDERGMTIENVPLTHTLVGGHGTGWWLGFDAGHAGDLSPGMTGVYKDLRISLRTDEVYRNMEYMKVECRSLARQIVDIGL